MDVGLGIAGLLCVALALGHETLGVVWVLPAVTGEDLPKTPFGPPAMTAATIHATWHIVTVFVLALGALLITLAWDADADAKTLLLRVFAVMWLVVAAVAIWAAARRVRNPHHLIRLPVPVFFVVVAVLCWIAST
jgi:hypothetical protein